MKSVVSPPFFHNSFCNDEDMNKMIKNYNQDVPSLNWSCQVSYKIDNLLFHWLIMTSSRSWLVHLDLPIRFQPMKQYFKIISFRINKTSKWWHFEMVQLESWWCYFQPMKWCIYLLSVVKEGRMLLLGQRQLHTYCFIIQQQYYKINSIYHSCLVIKLFIISCIFFYSYLFL